MTRSARIYNIVGVAMKKTIRTLYNGGILFRMEFYNNMCCNEKKHNKNALQWWYFCFVWSFYNNMCYVFKRIFSKFEKTFPADTELKPTLKH